MRRAVLLIGLLLVVRAHSASAECGIPQWNGTASTSVPARGSLYVYDAGLDVYPHSQEMSWEGAMGTAAVTKVGEELLRIDYDGLDGSVLIVNRRRYSLSGTWQRPVAGPRVSKYWHQLSAWTCSTTNTLVVQIDQPTAAIRARWTFGGTTTEWLIPSPGTDSTSQIQLGKINCGGTTLRPKELQAGGHLELVALRLDGSEVAIGGLPTFLSAMLMPTVGSLDERDFYPRKPTTSSGLGAIPWGGIVLVLLLACVCIIRVLRERSTTNV